MADANFCIGGVASLVNRFVFRTTGVLLRAPGISACLQLRQLKKRHRSVTALGYLPVPSLHVATQQPRAFKRAPKGLRSRRARSVARSLFRTQVGSPTFLEVLLMGSAPRARKGRPFGFWLPRFTVPPKKLLCNFLKSLALATPAFATWQGGRAGSPPRTI
jgi:hypothetical protein